MFELYSHCIEDLTFSEVQRVCEHLYELIVSELIFHLFFLMSSELSVETFFFCLFLSA